MTTWRYLDTRSQSVSSRWIKYMNTNKHWFSYWCIGCWWWHPHIIIVRILRLNQHTMQYFQDNTSMSQSHSYIFLIAIIKPLFYSSKHFHHEKMHVGKYFGPIIPNFVTEDGFFYPYFHVRVFLACWMSCSNWIGCRWKRDNQASCATDRCVIVVVIVVILSTNKVQ
jgi:hypothetical protein